LSFIEALKGIEITDQGGLLIGSMVTQSHLLKELRIRTDWPIISQVVTEIAHEQVRNRGTIGGSLSHSDPAAEWPALSLLLEAQFHVESATEKRILEADDFLIGIYETDLRENELLTSVYI